jgi:hypothetical protein
VHSELIKQLVRGQLEEAREAGLFGPDAVLEEVGFPAFYVRYRTVPGHERLLRFDCTEYDTFPVDVEPVDLITRVPLPPTSWMTRDGGAFPAHGDTQTPFLCVQATRRYYTHPGHDPLTTNEPWEKHRDEMRLVSLLGHIGSHFRLGRWT